MCNMFTLNVFFEKIYFFINFRSDIEKAVRQKKKFDFTHLILISKSYKAKGMDSEMFYSNPEEELFKNVSN